MKKTIITMLLALAFVGMQANPVDVETAKSLGIKFLNCNTEIKSASADLAYTAFADNGTPCFYVFAMQPKGFVIVSADDRSKPILGYSTESGFSANEIPDGLQSFFNNYQAGFSQMFANNDARTDEAVRDWMSLAETGRISDERITREIEPLLTCTWNQSALYNDLCPMDTLGSNYHVYAGCVATAMSQIMYYWQWPSTGTGMHSYSCFPYGDLIANFGAANYRYDLMPDFLDWTSTPEEIHAVALLQYHAGVSVDMQYSPEGSGASSMSVTDALINHFRYDDLSMLFDGLDWHLDSEWEEMLRENLDNAMPLYYSASGYDGGHAFVCDGYDDNGMFHFNWGWQGFDNGYYPINGFYLTNYSFPYYHQAIFGIYPNYDYCYVPKCVDNLQVDAIYTGTNRISFNAPTHNMCEYNISQLDSIVIVRNGQVIHTEYGVQAGAEVSFEDHDALGMSHYTVYPCSHELHGQFERDTILNGPTCEVEFQLHDSIGDGWLTKAISVVDSRGIAIKRIGLADGFEASVKLEVPADEELRLHWAYTIGGKDKESSFELYDWDGNLIYATEGKPMVGELCRFTSNCNVGNDETEESHVALYPNPATDYFMLESAVKEIKVFNALGQLVHQGENDVVDVYTWPQGVYFVRILDENDAVSTVKFVKQ